MHMQSSKMLMYFKRFNLINIGNTLKKNSYIQILKKIA